MQWAWVMVITLRTHPMDAVDRACVDRLLLLGHRVSTLHLHTRTSYVGTQHTGTEHFCGQTSAFCVESSAILAQGMCGLSGTPSMPSTQITSSALNYLLQRTSHKFPIVPM